MLSTEEIQKLVDKALVDHYLPPLDPDCSLDAGGSDGTPDRDDNDRYVLLERGHYGQTWLTWHPTPADAADYTLNQEYAEDWQASALIDCVTGDVLEPLDIKWGVRKP